jgi:hypothetical protein
MKLKSWIIVVSVSCLAYGNTTGSATMREQAKAGLTGRTCQP